MRWTITHGIRTVSRYALLSAVGVLILGSVLTTTFSVGRSSARVTTAVQVRFEAATGLDADVVAGVRQGMEPDAAFLGNVSDCTHYVHKNGDNTTGESLQTAWRTIAKAMQSLRAGQTACVSNDVYDEGPIVAAHSGTADHPIAVKPAPGASPIIRATSDKSLFDFQADGANPAKTSIGYWLVEGLDINKQRHDGAGVRVEGDAAGHAHHIVIRNNRIHDGKTGAAVLVRNRASNVLIDNNHIYEHHRFTLYQNYQKPGQKLLRVDYTYNKPNPLPSGQTYGRFDAHGVSVESESAPSRRNDPSVQRIGIQNNKLYNNGGDGVQCIGADDSGKVEYNADASDLDLVDNRIENNAENAVDIKSCQYVSIRGSASPDRQGPAADNKFLHYRPTNPNTDLPGNNSGGGAVVIHMNARFIEIENTRIWDACEGIAIGIAAKQVHDVVIRRSLMFDILRGGQCPTKDPAGTGIRITNASHVDIYHLTLDNLANKAVMVGSDNSGPYVLEDIDVFNTIISNSGRWIDLLLKLNQKDRVKDFSSDHNVFWQSSGTLERFLLNFNPTTLQKWRNQTGQDPASSTDDPRFVQNPRVNDYYTLAGSPPSSARDKAMPIPNMSVPACTGGPSVNPPDIGFRESC
jgi:hypothetical protein